MAVGGHGGGAPWCVGSVFPAPQLLTATSALSCKTSLLNLLQGGWEQIFVLQLSSLQSLF
jgi:hypothetical protein